MIVWSGAKKKKITLLSSSCGKVFNLEHKFHFASKPLKLAVCIFDWKRHQYSLCHQKYYKNYKKEKKKTNNSTSIRNSAIPITERVYKRTSTSQNRVMGGPRGEEEYKKPKKRKKKGGECDKNIYILRRRRRNNTDLYRCYIGYVVYFLFKMVYIN